MSASGKLGNKGGGRNGHGLDLKVAELKGTLLLAVLEDCKKFPARKLFWAEKFVNRLMPQDIKGSGEHGEIVFKFEE